jgi:lipopolysaccharide export system permease protein
MKILRTYTLKECVAPFVLSLSVLTCIFLLGNLVQLAHLVINKGVSISAVGRVFLFYIPMLLGYTLPIACLTAVILAFSRLSSDNEILAIRASGIHLKRLLLPLTVLGLTLSLFAVILNERIVPYAHHEQRKIVKNIGLQNPAAALEAGTFINAFKDQILFIYRIEGNRLYHVRIYQPQGEGKPTRTIIAKEGEFTPVPGENKIKLKLMDGTSDEPNLENPNNFYKLNFKNYFMTLDLSAEEKKVEKKPKSMTLKELEEKIAEMEALSVDTAPLRTEYYRKITWSFSILIFVLLGFALAVITNRRERTANVVLAIFCAAAYYVISLGCEALSIQNVTPIPITMWMPNIIGGVIAAGLNYRLCTS